MTTGEVLLLAARAGVTFWLEGDRLAYRAPEGRMTGELRDQVISHKAELIALLRQNRLEAAPPVASAPAPTDGPQDGPLASGQERLWLLERRLGPSCLYNIHFRLVWRGTLDRGALALSLRDIVARHAAMRTAFTESDGVPRAIIAAGDDAGLQHVDLRDHPPQERKRAAGQLTLEHQREPFDLAAGPLYRVTVVTLADDDHIVLVTQHHIITDGWSLRIFLAELGQGYRAHVLGGNPGPAEPPLRFADYVRWERQRRAEPGYTERLAWWKQHLAGLSPLALHRVRPPGHGPADFHGAVREFQVSTRLATRLKELAAERQCTLFTVLLTAWAILLHRHAGQSDFAVGTVTSGRERPEFQPVLGFFANTIVMRCDLSGNPSAIEAITRLQAETEAVFEREVPFSDIVLAAGAVRDTSLTPLIQAAFMFPKLPLPHFLGPDDAAGVGANVTADARIDGSVEGTAKFDLSLTMEETGDGITGSLEYATAIFSATAVQRISEHFLVLLQSIVQNPHETIGRLRLMSREEQQRLLEEWSNPDAPSVQPRNSSAERQALLRWDELVKYSSRQREDNCVGD